MTFLPIVDRELRTAARRPATYLVRVLALGVCLLAMACMMPLQVGGMVTPASWGREAFRLLTHLLYVLTLIAGMWATADCLSVEKREDTLGLLFLTNLNGLDIVLGKLAAHSIAMLGMVLAVMPAMALPLLMGGVSASEYGRAALVILNTLFFSLSAGLFISARSRNQRQTMEATLGLILLFTCGLPLAGVLCEAFVGAFSGTPTDPPWILLPFYAVSPGFAQALIVDLRRDFSWYPLCNWFLCFTDHRFFSNRIVQSLFFESILVVHGLSWFLLYRAGKRIERYRQEHGLAGLKRPLIQRLEEWLRGAGEARRQARRARLTINPYYWVADRDLMKQRVVWFFFIFVGLCGPWVWWVCGHEFPMYALIGLVHFVHPALKIWLAAEVCQTMAEDCRSGAFELILTTPLEVKSIVRSQVMALSKRFLAPMVLLLVVEFLLFRSALSDVGWGRDRATCEGLLLVGLFLLPDVLTIIWLGMWRGLASQKAGRAFFTTLTMVSLLPSIVYVTVLIISQDVWHGSSPWSTEYGQRGFYVLCGLAFIYDLVLLAWARHRILRQFHWFAAQH